MATIRSKIVDALATRLTGIALKSGDTTTFYRYQVPDPGVLNVWPAVFVPFPADTQDMYSDGLLKIMRLQVEVIVLERVMNVADIEDNHAIIAEAIETDYQWLDGSGNRVAQEGWITVSEILEGEPESMGENSYFMHRFVVTFICNPRFGNYGGHRP